MKKTLVALAAFAATAAFADATLYGNLDTSIVTGGKTSSGANAGTAFDGQGTWNGSIFGIKGSEDLGGGLKAVYKLEGGLDLGTGASGANGGGSANLFNRESNVGLSGGFGTVLLGNQFSPFVGAEAGSFAAFNLSTLVNWMAISGAGALGTSNGNGAFFVQNAVSYTTPTFSGFNATVLGQTQNSTGGGNSELALNYANGPMSLHYAYTAAPTNYSTTANSGFATSVVSGTYAINKLTVGAGYIQSAAKGTAGLTAQPNDVKSYVLSAAYPVTGALTVSGAYMANNETTKQSVSSVSGQYALSKATFLYVTLADGKNTAPLHTVQTAATGTSIAFGLNKGF